MAKSIVLTATGQVATGVGSVAGFIINSHTSGTLKLWDNTSAAGKVLVDTFTFPAGSSVQFFPLPIEYNIGLFATVGGTINVNIIQTPSQAY